MFLIVTSTGKVIHLRCTHLKCNLSFINQVDFPELVRCRNFLRDKGELNDSCAFKLAEYLKETDK